MSFRLLGDWWQSIRTSLWFVPVLCVIVAVFFSFLFPEIDRRINGQDSSVSAWVFSGSADGARSILSTIAGSLVTIVGVVFSITIVVLQQAANQFTPRVMGNFMRQTGTQLVLGVFVATFLYSLLVLRYVRGEAAQVDEFIPRLSVAMSIVFAGACIGLLIYFVHHMATSLQASMVITNVNGEFQREIKTLYPEHIGEAADEPDQPLETFRREFMGEPVFTIQADRSGFIRNINDDGIINNAGDCDAVAILPQIGHFVTYGETIVELGKTTDLPENACDTIRRSLILGHERSPYQDPLFSIRQMADIALMALSPGVNDPTTATNAISALGDSIAHLASRRIPERIRVISGKEDSKRTVYVWANRPTFHEFVENAFSEIRRQAISKVAVTSHLVTTLGTLGDVVSTPFRAEPIHHQLDEIEYALVNTTFSSADESYVRSRIQEARQNLPIRL